MLVYEVWRFEDQAFSKTFGVDYLNSNFLQLRKWKPYLVKFRLGKRIQLNTTKSMKYNLVPRAIYLAREKALGTRLNEVNF